MLRRPRTDEDGNSLTTYYVLADKAYDADWRRRRIESGNNNFLGWSSAQGKEIADADPLSQVFKEVLARTPASAADVLERGPWRGRTD